MAKKLLNAPYGYRESVGFESTKEQISDLIEENENTDNRQDIDIESNKDKIEDEIDRSKEIDDKMTKDLSELNENVFNGFVFIKKSVLDETEARMKEDNALSGKISDETNRAKEVELTLTNNLMNLSKDVNDGFEDVRNSISLESQTRENADKTLDDKINDEAEDIRQALSLESQTRENADKSLEEEIEKGNKAISLESQTRENADNALNEKVDGEIENRTNEEENIKQALSLESQTRENADKTLDDKINDEAEDIRQALSLESQTRENADKTLDDKFNEESKARTAKDAELTERIETEENTRLTSLNDINERLAQEVEKTNLGFEDVNKKLFDETERAVNAEKKVANDIVIAENKINSKIELLDAAVALEASDRDASDKAINVRIDDEILRAKAAEETIKKSVVVVNDSLINNFEITSNTISDEILNRGKGDKDIQEKVDFEVERATAREKKLNELITREAGRAIDEENEIKIDINNLKSRGVAIDNKIGSIVLNRIGSLRYQLVIDGEIRGEIDIPKDQFLKSVKNTGSSLIFVFATAEGDVTETVDLTKYIDTYMAGDGLETSASKKFAIKIDHASEKYLTLSSKGLGIKGIDEEIAFLKAKIASLEDMIRKFN